MTQWIGCCLEDSMYISRKKVVILSAQNFVKEKKNREATWTLSKILLLYVSLQLLNVQRKCITQQQKLGKKAC